MQTRRQRKENTDYSGLWGEVELPEAAEDSADDKAHKALRDLTPEQYIVMKRQPAWDSRQEKMRCPLCLACQVAVKPGKGTALPSAGQLAAFKPRVSKPEQGKTVATLTAEATQHMKRIKQWPQVLDNAACGNGLRQHCNNLGHVRVCGPHNITLAPVWSKATTATEATATEAMATEAAEAGHEREDGDRGEGEGEPAGEARDGVDPHQDPAESGGDQEGGGQAGPSGTAGRGEDGDDGQAAGQQRMRPPRGKRRRQIIQDDEADDAAEGGDGIASAASPSGRHGNTDRADANTPFVVVEADFPKLSAFGIPNAVLYHSRYIFVHKQALWKYVEQQRGVGQQHGGAAEAGGLNVLAAAAVVAGQQVQRAAARPHQAGQQGTAPHQQTGQQDRAAAQGDRGGLGTSGVRTTEERVQRFTDCQAGTSGRGADLLRHISTPLLLVGTNIVPPRSNIATAHACEIVSLGVAAKKCSVPADSAPSNELELNIYEIDDMGQGSLGDAMRGIGPEYQLFILPPSGERYVKLKLFGGAAEEGPADTDTLAAQIGFVYAMFSHMLDQASHSLAHELASNFRTNGSMGDMGIDEDRRYTQHREEMFLSVFMITLVTQFWLEQDLIAPGSLAGQRSDSHVLAPTKPLLTMFASGNTTEKREFLAAQGGAHSIFATARCLLADTFYTAKSAIKLRSVQYFRRTALVELFGEASMMHALEPPPLMLAGTSSIEPFLQADPSRDFAIFLDEPLSFKLFSIEQFVAPDYRPQLRWLVLSEGKEREVRQAWKEVMAERNNIPFMCVGAMSTRIAQLVFREANFTTNDYTVPAPRAAAGAATPSGSNRGGMLALQGAESGDDQGAAAPSGGEGGTGAGTPGAVPGEVQGAAAPSGGGGGTGAGTPALQGAESGDDQGAAAPSGGEGGTEAGTPANVAGG